MFNIIHFFLKFGQKWNVHVYRISHQWILPYIVGLFVKNVGWNENFDNDRNHHFVIALILTHGTVTLIRYMHVDAFHVTCPLWGNMSVTGRFPSQQTDDLELWSFLYCWIGSEFWNRYLAYLIHIISNYNNAFELTNLWLHGSSLKIWKYFDRCGQNNYHSLANVPLQTV